MPLPTTGPPTLAAPSECREQASVAAYLARLFASGGPIAELLTFDLLEAWIDRHYRDRLAAPDLVDPQLRDESYRALDELTGILRLPAIYPFQRN